MFEVKTLDLIESRRLIALDGIRMYNRNRDSRVVAGAPSSGAGIIGGGRPLVIVVDLGSQPAGSGRCRHAVRVRLVLSDSARLGALARDPAARSYFDHVRVPFPPEDERLYEVAMTEWTMTDFLKYVLFNYFFGNRRRFADVCVAEASGEGGKVRFLVDGTLALFTLPDEASPKADVTTDVNLQLLGNGRRVPMLRNARSCLETMAQAAEGNELCLDLVATVAGNAVDEPRADEAVTAVETAGEAASGAKSAPGEGNGVGSEGKDSSHSVTKRARRKRRFESIRNPPIRQPQGPMAIDQVPTILQSSACHGRQRKRKKVTGPSVGSTADSGDEGISGRGEEVAHGEDMIIDGRGIGGSGDTDSSNGSAEIRDVPVETPSATAGVPGDDRVTVASREGDYTSHVSIPIVGRSQRHQRRRWREKPASHSTERLSAAAGSSSVVETNAPGDDEGANGVGAIVAPSQDRNIDERGGDGSGSTGSDSSSDGSASTEIRDVVVEQHFARSDGMTVATGEEETSGGANDSLGRDVDEGGGLASEGEDSADDDGSDTSSSNSDEDEESSDEASSSSGDESEDETPTKPHPGETKDCGASDRAGKRKLGPSGIGRATDTVSDDHDSAKEPRDGPGPASVSPGECATASSRSHDIVFDRTPSLTPNSLNLQR